MPNAFSPHASPRSDAPSLAPPWHTLALISFLALGAVVGLLSRHAPPDRAISSSFSTLLVRVYLPMLAVSAMLVLYVARLFRPRWELESLVRRKGRSASDLSIDVAIAAASFVAIRLTEHLVSHGGTNAAASSMLPHTLAEKLAWAVVAVVVSTSEELVYRGYLQTQLTAMTRSSALAIVLQAALFGLVHGEQGLAAALRIGLYGLLFGVITRARGSLVPVIFAHVATDVVSGVVSS